MNRRRMFQTFKAATAVGNFSEAPMLPVKVDPQVHLSRNSVPQPFHLICGKDTVLAQMSGESVIYLKHSTVISFNVGPGDNVYVPAGTPHQVIPLTECVQLRYKAQQPGLEGVAWFCPGCDTELRRAEWDTEVIVSQRAYHDACTAFNEQASARTCRRCDTVHPTIDLTPFAAWLDIAADLEAERLAALKKAALATQS